MQIKLEQYIKNPTGGRAHVVGERDAVAAIYQKKFGNIMLRVAGKIDHFLYRNEEDRFLFYIKIPSESVKDLTYDVIIDFYTTEAPTKTMRSLSDYYVRFFSNDPNFTFTYAYTFKKNGILVPEFIHKFQDLKSKPLTTNPNYTVGYVKSIYMAYLYLTSRGYMQKSTWFSAPKVDISALDSMIMNADDKLIQYQKLKQLEKATSKGSMHISDTNDLQELKYKAKQVEVLNKRGVYSGKVKTVKKVKRI